MNERDREAQEIESGNAWLDTDEVVETDVVVKRPLEAEGATIGVVGFGRELLGRIKTPVIRHEKLFFL